MPTVEHTLSKSVGCGFESHSWYSTFSGRSYKVAEENAISVNLNLTGVPSTMTELHVHIEYAVGLQTAVEALMANMADLLARITVLQDGQTELLKDVRRLIAEGNTDAAVARVDELIAKNTELDTEVEAASPEAAPTPPEEENPIPA